MAHPLLDRHEATAARETPHTDLGALVALVAEIAVTNHLLERMLQQDRADTAQLCVTDREPAQLVMADFPVVGARRLITRRTGDGGNYALTQNTPVTVLASSETRLGGQIVNTGTNPVFLYLAGDLLSPGSSTPLPEGVPIIWLAASGGAWDLRLGNVLWCGTVIALATAGASSVVAAEV